MGRPRAFQEEQVIGRALEVFWARGYQRTTVVELTSATGLAAQSLYGAFGNKQRLFRRALERYAAEGRVAVREALESGETPLAGIRAYLDRQVTLACEGHRQRGCLMANTALELLPGDAAVQAAVGTNFADIHSELSNAVRRAQAVGEIDRQRSAGVIGWQLLVLVEGLQVLGRTAGRDELQAVVIASLDDLSATRPSAQSAARD